VSMSPERDEEVERIRRERAETPTIAQSLQRSALRAYERWVQEPGAGAAHAGDTDVRDGFVAGFLAACKEWGPF
jgi:hypothetical protein